MPPSAPASRPVHRDQRRLVLLAMCCHFTGAAVVSVTGPCGAINTVDHDPGLPNTKEGAPPGPRLQDVTTSASEHFSVRVPLLKNRYGEIKVL